MSNSVASARELVAANVIALPQAPAWIAALTPGTFPWRELTLHVLASDAPALALENPRQIPVWRYSPRFGVLPPCFAGALPARCSNQRALAAYDALRVYTPHAEHLGPVARAPSELAPHAVLELAMARLCRAELLVEIEAVSLGRRA